VESFERCMYFRCLSTGVECWHVLLATYTAILLVCINFIKKSYSNHNHSYWLLKQHSTFVCFANRHVTLIFVVFYLLSYFKNSHCNSAIAKLLKRTPNFVAIPSFPRAITIPWRPRHLMWFCDGPNWQIKFEVASFSHSENMKGEPKKFWEFS